MAGSREIGGLGLGSIAARTVAARSAAEIPVLTSRLASMLTQNAVLNGARAF